MQDFPDLMAPVSVHHCTCDSATKPRLNKVKVKCISNFLSPIYNPRKKNNYNISKKLKMT